jgi:hypothetical protein
MGSVVRTSQRSRDRFAAGPLPRETPHLLRSSHAPLPVPRIDYQYELAIIFPEHSGLTEDLVCCGALRFPRNPNVPRSSGARRTTRRSATTSHAPGRDRRNVNVLTPGSTFNPGGCSRRVKIRIGAAASPPPPVGGEFVFAAEQVVVNPRDRRSSRVEDGHLRHPKLRYRRSDSGGRRRCPAGALSAGRAAGGRGLKLPVGSARPELDQSQDADGH